MAEDSPTQGWGRSLGQALYESCVSLQQTVFYWEEGASLLGGWLCVWPGWPWERALYFSFGETEEKGISLVAANEVSAEG